MARKKLTKPSHSTKPQSLRLSRHEFDRIDQLANFFIEFASIGDYPQLDKPSREFYELLDALEKRFKR